MKRREFIAGLGATAWPLAAQAQQTGVPPNQTQPLPTDPVIGFLDMFGPVPPVGGNKADGGESRQNGGSLIAAFRKGIEDGGFGGEANLFVLYRSAGGNFRLLPSLVADLVGRRVAVIVAIGALAPASRAKAATPTIPIVFLYGGDPVQDQLVASLNRPGGKVTGMTALR
jgi:putative tryptophan/tyrosine transport system substrate-binding protein